MPRILLIGVIFAFAGAHTTTFGDDSPQLTAGVAKRKVTPPVWVPYLTSSGNGTSAPFEGIHDDLFAAALVLDDGQRSIAVLAVDSIGYDNAVLGPGRDFTAELRRRIAARTKLRPEAIMLAASHTHSAPETIGLSPFRDQPRVAQWLENHLEELAATVIEAAAQRVPVNIRHGVARVPDVARCRRILLKDGTLNRQGALPDTTQVAIPWQIDDQLNVLYLETAAGKPHAVLLNYTAHPIVAMLLPHVSANYPGAAMKHIEQSLPGAVCLFTQGACGNINSSRVSTSFEDVGQLGGTLGRAAIETIERIKQSPPIAPSKLSADSETVGLAARDCPPLAEAQRLMQEQPSAANASIYRLARKLDEGPIRAEVQSMKIGSVRWVGLPGEAFVETGLALKQHGATFVVGYANGYVGYLPIRRAYGEGGYEAGPGVWSRVAPGSAERLQAIGEQLLE